MKPSARVKAPLPTGWNALLRDNPMMAEVSAANRRFIGWKGWTAGQIASLVLIGSVYLFFLVMVIRFADGVDPKFLIWALFGLLGIAIPLTLHGVVAGEKERRSLEMLLAAPVTSMQIVIAKTLRAWLSVAGITAAMAVPFVIVMIAKLFIGGLEWDNPSLPPWIGYTMAILVVACATVVTACLTTLVSSMMKSVTAALVASIGFFFVLYTVNFTTLAVASGVNDWLGLSIGMWNPMAALIMVFQGGPQRVDAWLIPFVLGLSCAGWLAVSAGSLWLAAKMIDRERK